MRDYGLVYSKFWTSSDVRDLSDDAKLLAAYLLTTEHGTIAGVCRLPDGYVSEDLKWSCERVSEGFRELFANGFANRCETTKWVWVCKHFDWNLPKNPNQWTAARKWAAEVPAECCWSAAFRRVFARAAGDPEPTQSELFGNPSPTIRHSVSVSVSESVSVSVPDESGLAAQPACTHRGVNGKANGTGAGNGHAPVHARTDAVGTTCAADFEALKAAYPPRSGSQRWADAKAHYATNLGAGTTPAEMLAGAKRYAEYCTAEGLTGTAKVQQARTFLGPNRGWCEPWEPAPRKLKPGEQWLLDEAAKDAAKAAQEPSDAQH